MMMANTVRTTDLNRHLLATLCNDLTSAEIMKYQMGCEKMYTDFDLEHQGS
jgi:hypothetical protein